MRSFFAMIAVLGAGTIRPATAVVIQVPSVQPTIQAGIDAAATGDTVLVAAGVYTGLGNRDLDFGGKDLVLLSESGRVLTIIDAQGAGRGFLFQSGETAAAVVDGFTIRNGVSSSSGGGFWITGGSTPTIRDCRLEANQAITGGGIYAASSSVTLAGCDFDGNTGSNYGGGVYGFAAGIELGGCSFTDNEAGIGAGVYVVEGSTVEVSDCDFTQNIPLNTAGGFYGHSSSVTFRRCSVVGSTGTLGAGVYLFGGMATVDSCTFRMNTAEYAGGGLYAEQVNALTVTRCTFEGNATLGFASSVPSGGGGLYYDAPEPPAAAPYIGDCTFVDNRALETGSSGGTGGGLRGRGQDALMERCTFAGNRGEGAGGGASFVGRVHGCVFEGNSTDGFGGGLRGGREVIDCRFSDNRAEDSAGGCYLTSSAAFPASVAGCEFNGNFAPTGGAVSFASNFGPLSVMDCRFRDNVGGNGGAIAIFAGADVSISGSAFERNAAFAGGAAWIKAGQSIGAVTFSSCTMVGSGAVTGGCLNVAELPVDVQKCIIAFGTEGGAVSCEDEGVVTLSCTDIFGNAGGDWTGCIADHLGIQGNFSADPLFCNVGGGDYTLAETSPCAPEHSPAGCGLIGAFPVACVNPIGIAETPVPPVLGDLRVTPNPIGPGSVIEWVNVNAAPLNLRLYDPMGRLVTSRSLGPVPEGRQELRWDGLVRDRTLPPGVYLLKLGGPTGGMGRARVIVVR